MLVMTMTSFLNYEEPTVGFDQLDDIANLQTSTASGCFT
jgi:hypothetical protein